MRRSLVVLAAVVLGLAACGGASRVSASQTLDWDAGVLNVQVCAGMGFHGTVSYTGYRCKGSAAADTNFLLTSTIDKWGLNGAVRASLLNDASSHVQDVCSECAAILDRAARQSSGWPGVNPFIWIPVLWCLIGGILGAVLARRKNRRTWEGALLGVLLGLLGVLLVALLPRGADTPATPPAVEPPPAITRPPSAAQPPPDEENPLELARARYASGEITREEFEEITASLGHPGWSPRI